MNGANASWNFGLLFASLTVLLGIIGVVSTRQTARRWLASGLFIQGLILVFVVSSVYFHASSGLKLCTLAGVGLAALIQTFLGPNFVCDDETVISPGERGASAPQFFILLRK